MANIFEELMQSHAKLTESLKPSKPQSRCNCKKFSCKKFRLESLRIFEDVDLDELDAEFDVDPEEASEDEVVLIIDPELPTDEEVPEEAAENIVGDLVYKCPVCGANYVCDPENENEFLSVDEEGVPTECPVCGDDSEQILVGEIAPAEEVEGEDNQEMEPVDSEDEEEESEEDEEVEEDFEEEEYQEESLRRRVSEGKDKDNSSAVIKKIEKVLNKYYNDKNDLGYSKSGGHFRLVDLSKDGKGQFSDIDVDPDNKSVTIKGDIISKARSEISDVIKSLGFEEKSEKEESLRRVTEAKIQTTEIDNQDSNFAAELTGKELFKSPKADKKSYLGTVNKVEKKKGNYYIYLAQKEEPIEVASNVAQKFYVADSSNKLSKKVGKDKAYDSSGQETRDYKEKDKRLAASYHPPVSKRVGTRRPDISASRMNRSRAVQEAKATRTSTAKKTVDRPYTFKETKFESLMTKMIRENYKTNKSFKVTRAYLSDGKLNLNYTVGNKRGTFVAEGFDKKATKMKLRIKDKGVFTESLTKVPSFIVECVCVNKSVIPMRIRYNYTKQVKEQLYRVRGEVK